MTSVPVPVEPKGSALGSEVPGRIQAREKNLEFTVIVCDKCYGDSESRNQARLLVY